jgi:hypothetical protein
MLIVCRMVNCSIGQLYAEAFSGFLLSGLYILT